MRTVKTEPIDRIDWIENVGVEDSSDIITKRKDWWIKLVNGQIAHVAQVIIVINPFSCGDRVMEYEYRISYPGLKYQIEFESYGKALIQAGLWMGTMLAWKKGNEQ